MSRAILKKGLKYIFLAGAVLGLGSVIWVGLIPGDPKNAVFGSLSLARALLLAGLVALTLTLVWIFFLIRRARVEELFYQRIEARLKPATAISSIAWLGLHILISLPSYRFSTWIYIYQRAYPAMVAGYALLTIWLLWLLAHFVKRGFWIKLRQEVSAKRTLVIWAFIFTTGIVLLMAITKFGQREVLEGWYKGGVPLLAWQFQVALLAAMIFFLAVSSRGFSLSSRIPVLVLFIAFWLAAGFAWNQVAPAANYFFTTSDLTQQTYPYSDARRYVLNAQTLQAGEEFDLVEDKPFYIYILSVIQRFTGADYWKTASIQAALMAVIPALLFLLGTQMHSREFGIMLGILALFHEINAYHLGQSLDLSHSKLLMTEMPLALLLVLLAVTAFRWFSSRHVSLYLPVVVGGIAGIAALTRLNAYILIPAIGVYSWFVYRQRRLLPRWPLHVGLLLLGALLVVLPWNMYTYQQLGTPYSILKTTRSLENRSALPEGPEITAYPVIKSVVNVQRMPPERVTKEAWAELLIRGRHFLHNEALSLFILPLTLSFEDTGFYAEQPMWSSALLWDGRLTPGSWAILSVNLLVLAVGIRAGWKAVSWAGLLPLFLHLTYNFSNGVAAKSGGRYLVPVGWVGYLYFALGAWVLLMWLGRNFFMFTRQVSTQGTGRVTSSKGGFLLVTGLVLCAAAGMAIPATIAVADRGYREYQAGELYSLVSEDDAFSAVFPTEEHLQRLLTWKRGLALSGRLLYPEYVASLPRNPHGGEIEKGDFPQLYFSFASQMPLLGVLPLEEQALVKGIPFEGEVIVVGCRAYLSGPAIIVEALILLGEDGIEKVITRSPWVGPRCNYPGSSIPQPSTQNLPEKPGIDDQIAAEISAGIQNQTIQPFHPSPPDPRRSVLLQPRDHIK
jgi:hypothetical protein